MGHQQKEQEDNSSMASIDDVDNASVAECSFSYQHIEQEEDLESNCSSSGTTDHNQSSSNAAKKAIYKVLTTNQLEGMMKALAQEVAPIVGCDSAECVDMLRHTD